MTTKQKNTLIYKIANRFDTDLSNVVITTDGNMTCINVIKNDTLSTYKLFNHDELYKKYIRDIENKYDEVKCALYERFPNHIVDYLEISWDTFVNNYMYNNDLECDVDDKYDIIFRDDDDDIEFVLQKIS